MRSFFVRLALVCTPHADSTMRLAAQMGVTDVVADDGLYAPHAPADDAEALAWTGNPIDTLEPLARAGVAPIHVVGDADNVVPPEENAVLVAERFRAIGGTVELIHKPGIGHHPHGLDDPTPVVEFIVRHAVPR